MMNNRYNGLAVQPYRESFTTHEVTYSGHIQSVVTVEV